MAREQSDDADLLAALRDGPAEQQRGREALRELYERHGSAVLAFARRVVGDRQLAEDVLQETFLALPRRAAAWRGGSVKAWLLAIAGGRARDLLRGGHRRRQRERSAARSEGADATSEDPVDMRLEAHLNALPAKLRAAVELRSVQGLEHAQVAEALGVSLRTAKSWSQQGLQRLRERMEND